MSFVKHTLIVSTSLLLSMPMAVSAFATTLAGGTDHGMKKKHHSQMMHTMKKKVPTATENKQGPSGGQAGGTAGSS